MVPKGIPLLDGVTSASLYGRMARAEEIADPIVFLCSPAASYMTGSTLTIDAGATIEGGQFVTDGRADLTVLRN